jgi:hypothetical protein
MEQAKIVPTHWFEYSLPLCALGQGDRYMNRRRFVLANAGMAALIIRGNAYAQAVELELVDMPSPSPSATPSDELEGNRRDLYDGPVEDLWNHPWEIGDKLVEVGATIVQRFIAAQGKGYRLGVDGLVFPSVIYAKHGFQTMLFIGFNTDLSELAGARTLKVIGTYGGVQLNTDSRWEDPILVAQEIVAP